MGIIDWMRAYPLRLYALMTLLVIPYFVVILLYPTASSSRDVFFLPALIIGRVNLILVLIAVGFTLSAAFYANQTGQPVRGYGLFAFTVVWMFALISLGNMLTINDGVIYEESIDYAPYTYHVAYSPAAITCDGPGNCTENIMVYECNQGGWFCNVIGREIPVLAGGGVYLRVVGDEDGRAVQVAQNNGIVVFEKRDWVCRLPHVCQRQDDVRAVVDQG